MDLAARMERVTAEHLWAAGSFKWTLFPGTLAAWIAEMDFGLAPVVETAIAEAARRPGLGYLPLSLEAELAEAVAGYLATSYRWPVPAAAVRAVPDVLRGLELMLDHLLLPGTPVVVPTPTYHPFLEIPPRHGRRVIEVPMRRDAAGVWRMDVEALEAALAPGALLVLCNPHNPLGRVFTRAELAEVAAVVERTGARVFSDEIHAPLVYAPHCHTPYAGLSPEAARHTVTAMAASKAFNMPGLKCAQVVLSNELDREKWDALGYFETRGASNLGVAASIAAYRDGGPWLSEVLDYLRGNRDELAALVARHLPGAVHDSPEATYLGWIDLAAISDRAEHAEFLRERAGVAVSGGEECGEVGRGSIRVNFATPRHLLAEVVQRIGAALSDSR